MTAISSTRRSREGTHRRVSAKIAHAYKYQLMPRKKHARRIEPEGGGFHGIIMLQRPGHLR